MGLCRRCGIEWPDPLRRCPEHGIDLEDSEFGEPTGVRSLRRASQSRRTTQQAQVQTPALKDELVPGTLLGEYQVARRLGQGPLGCVYSAMHPTTGRRAAARLLRSNLAGNVHALGVLIQEARTISRIGHPSLVDVIGFGALPDGRCYLLMEWLEGESLQARLARGRLPLADVLDLVVQIASALEAAHDHVIVHQAIDPGNIFLEDVPSARTRARLLDFGLSHLAADGPTPCSGGGRTTLTGLLVGNPSYLSPEQARGEKVTGASDVYALGVLAYQLVLGRLPFVAASPLEVIALHLEKAPPAPRHLWRDIPTPLDRLLRAMLDKDPARRPPPSRIIATVDRLRNVLQPPPVASRSYSRAPSEGAGHRGLRLAVLGIGVGLLAAACLYGAALLGAAIGS